MPGLARIWKQDRWLLEAVSLGWLALPFAVFAAGWLRAWVAAPAILLTLVGVWRALAAGPWPAPAPHDDAVDPRRARVAWALAGLLTVGVVLYSGTGGFAFQFGGHWRNNAFVKDLIEHPWPLGFSDVGARHEPGVLAFYLAHAIVPAAVGKLLGWNAALLFQFAWTCLGVFLALCWLLRVVGDRGPQWIVLFFLFGGLDWIGYRLLVGPYPGTHVELDLWTVFLSLRRPEMAHVFWIFPSNATILFNSPHHVLCSWVVVLMILDDAIHRGTSRRVGLLVSFALLWSAFSFVGMAPFVLVSLAWTRGRGMWSFENLVSGVVVLGLSALYIGTNDGAYVQGPLWRFQDLGETAHLLLAVWCLEFGVYALLVPLVERRRVGIGHPVWLATAVASLCAVSLYRMGDNNDFTTKASIPALLVLQLAVAHALGTSPWRRRWAGVALIGVLLVGSAAPVVLLTRSVRLGLHAPRPAFGDVAPTNELERCSRGGQLFSDGRGFFWHVLAREPVLQPNEPWDRPTGGLSGGRRGCGSGDAR